MSIYFGILLYIKYVLEMGTTCTYIDSYYYNIETNLNYPNPQIQTQSSI